MARSGMQCLPSVQHVVRTFWGRSFAAPDCQPSERLDTSPFVIEQHRRQVGIWILGDALCGDDLQKAGVGVPRRQMRQTLCQEHAAFVTACEHY